MIESLIGLCLALTAIVVILGRLWWSEQRAHAEARVRIATLAGELAVAAEKIPLADSRAQIEQMFTAVSAGVVKDSRDQLVRETAGVVAPLKDSLGQLEEKIRLLESARSGAYSGLLTEVAALREAHGTLADRAASLSAALTSQGTQGRWGEMTLRRITELAGMTHHVHIESQVTMGDQRPDMVVRIPGGGDLPVDAKVTLTDYLAAMGEADTAKRAASLKAHAAAVKRRIQELGKKEYWKQFAAAPEFVVMFVPIEASLGAAFEHEPDLLDVAAGQRVLIATPVTLLALLKAVAFGWQQRQVTDNIRQIETECRTLHDRLGVFLRHLGDAGKKLGDAVDGYNKAVASAEQRVLPSVRRIEELGAITDPAPQPARIDAAPRLPREEAQA